MTESTAPLCPSCRAPRQAQSRFCGQCGTRFEEPTTARMPEVEHTNPMGSLPPVAHGFPASVPAPVSGLHMGPSPSDAERGSPAFRARATQTIPGTPMAGPVVTPVRTADRETAEARPLSPLPAPAPAARNPSTPDLQRSPTPAAPVPVQDDPLVGRLIEGRYRVLDRLGAGGMGTVYRVRHEHMHKVMALKVLNPQISADPVVRARFRREARAASLLESRHTVAVFDFGETADGLLYLCMEYLRGRSLAALIKDRGTISPARTIRIMQQVLRSLEEAHAQGIVHRDIKPDNIFLVDSDEQDLAKVLDFGIAKGDRIADAPMAAVAGTPASGGHATRGDLVVGTPEYMAPEQARGQAVDGRADLWACGVVIYEALTGKLPFQGENAVDVLVAVLEKKPPAPEPGLVPPGLARVMERALAKKVADRFTSAAEMRTALQAAADELSSVGFSSTPTTSPPVVRSDPSLDPLPNFDDDEEAVDRDEWSAFARREQRKKSAVLGLLLASVVGAGWVAKPYLIPAGPNDREVEPNDEVAQATLVGPGVTVEGTLTPRGDGKRDQDRFVMALPDGPQVLSAQVRPRGPSTINLGLTAWVDGKVVFSGWGRKVAHPRVPNLAVQGKHLHIMVREENATTDHPPFPEAVDYMLSVDPLRPLKAGEEREPNDDIGAATVLQRGGAVEALLLPSDDLDTWRLEFPGDDAELEVEAAPTQDLALELNVIGPDGRRQARKSGKAGERVTLGVGIKKCGSPCYLQVEGASHRQVSDPAYRLVVR